MRSNPLREATSCVLNYFCTCVVFFLFTISATQAQTELPTTWRDDYFPQFHVTIAPEDLEALLAPGSTAKVPMTLDYQGQLFSGTIRQRLGNTSLCGDTRQFRFDFAGKTKFPDGYVSDRFETDRGNCYALHEWIAWKVMDQAAALRPDLKVLRKKSNMVAIYFNGNLYHVQTLLEDVNKDLLEPQLGTRKITIYDSGCQADIRDTDLVGLCATFVPSEMQNYLHLPSFLYALGVVQLLGGVDNYPKYPYNYHLVQETDTKRVWFLVDDMDATIDSYSDGQSDPFQTYITAGDSQKHFTELMNDPDSRAQYRALLRELLPLFEPDKLQPLVATKYAQIRETLHATPNLPLGADWYDYVYQTEVPKWIPARHAYLTTLLAQEDAPINRPPTAVIAPLPATLEATANDGIQVTLNGAGSTDPDNDPLTYSWKVDGQEVGQTAIIDSKLSVGTHIITLSVNDGRDGIGTATAHIEIMPMPPPAPSIYAVSSSQFLPDSAAILEISGTGFSPDSVVSFNTSGIYAYWYHRRNENLIIVYIYADSFVTHGYYDVTVTNPDGKTATAYQSLFVGF